MATVSVIVPAYNAEQFIGECIESVLNQSLKDLEMIIVDDGSTDGTLDVIRKYAESDPRLSVLTQANQFAGVARNNGMMRATGEYYYFLDSDDYIDKNALQDMVDAARSCNADVVVCRARSFSMKDKEVLPISYALRDYALNTPLAQEDIAKTLFRSVVGWPWDKLFKASFIKDTGLEYQPLRSTNDAYFVFMAMALAKTTYCLDKELVTHRINNMKSISNTRRKSWNNALIAMDAIEEKLHDEGIYELFERTFLNWRANFVYWNVSTLDKESALGLLEAVRPKMIGMPLEKSFYFLARDYDFVRSFNMTPDELVLQAMKQREEYQKAKRVYSSRPYKLAVKLAKPARFVKHRILRK